MTVLTRRRALLYSGPLPGPPSVGGGGGYGTVAYGGNPYGGSTTFTPSTPSTPVNLGALVLFQTPVVAVIPRWLPDSTPQQYLLYRHMANENRGVNVWLCSDGTYRVDYPCNYEEAQTSPAAFFSPYPIGPDEVPPQTPPATTTDTSFYGGGAMGPDLGVPATPSAAPSDPFPALVDTNLAYPWNPFPGSTISETPGNYATVYDWTEQMTEFTLNPYFTRWYAGGHILEVTQEEALALTAAGFGDCLS